MPDFSKMTPTEFAAWQAEQNTPPAQRQSENGNPYAVTTWGSQFYDFEVPSGQRCQMKKLRPEELVGTDMLDRITRLPGFAEEEIRKASGLPPEKQSNAIDKGQLEALLSVLNDLIPIVVVQPRVLSVPPPDQERVEGVVYVDDIELADRVAIMERALSGVKSMDNFRPEAGGSAERLVDESGHELSA